MHILEYSCVGNDFVGFSNNQFVVIIFTKNINQVKINQVIEIGEHIEYKTASFINYPNKYIFY